MSATFTSHRDHVSVQIDGNLGYDVWRILRDARNAALAAKLPLRLEIDKCATVDMAGIGTLLIAQERLPHVELSGCPQRFIESFRVLGVCEHCATTRATNPNCPKARNV